MSTLWLSKEIRPELDVAAFVETQETGWPMTRTKLAREIFSWAFEQYRKAGSLRRLTSAQITFTKSCWLGDADFEEMRAEADRRLQSLRGHRE